MSGEGTYVCTLDEGTINKAQQELNEIPQERASHIETLRLWVKSQPHINSRTDDHFLLRFLRRTKFSQLKAQELVDNFWSVRTSPLSGVPEWFDRMDPENPKLQELVDLGCNIPLPGRDKENRKVILIRTGAWDPKVHDFGDVMRLGFMTSDILLTDELTQVHGMIILLDFELLSTAHAWYWDRATVGKAMKCWQDVYPTRNKGTNFYMTPTIFNAIFEIFKFFMKEKTQKRLKFHKDSMESLHKEIPKYMLPQEYGGEAGPIKDIIAEWKKEMLNKKKEFLLNAQYGVDESKRHKKDDTASGWGIVGSFRKLAVD